MHNTIIPYEPGTNELPGAYIPGIRYQAYIIPGIFVSGLDYSGSIPFHLRLAISIICTGVIHYSPKTSRLRWVRYIVSIPGVRFRGNT